MALSDVCFEFLQAVSSAAEELAQGVHHYSDPESPIRYGLEIDALRRACGAVKDAPYDPEAKIRLLRLTSSIMAFHDTPPDDDPKDSRQAAMTKLIRILEAELGDDDATAVPALVGNVVAETGYTRSATERLKVMLPKFGKSSYEIVIKIISDIGSATAKKILGL
ncbi:MAG TPA: DUF2321 domain-containing protein [Xanthobacteraceae bacterium]|jgi:hypothetical protein